MFYCSDIHISYKISERVQEMSLNDDSRTDIILSIILKNKLP